MYSPRVFCQNTAPDFTLTFLLLLVAFGGGRSLRAALADGTDVVLKHGMLCVRIVGIALLCDGDVPKGILFSSIACFRVFLREL